MNRHAVSIPDRGSAGRSGKAPGLPADGRLGLLLVVAAAGLWATVGVATRLVPEAGRLPDELLAFARLMIGAPVILLAAQLGGARPGNVVPRLPRRDLTAFALSSAVFQVCLFRCFTLLGVTLTVFLTVALPPLIGLVWSMLRRSANLTLPVLAALGLDILGLTSLLSPVDGLVGPDQVALGLALAVVASVAFVVMSLAVRRLTEAGSAAAAAGAGLALSALVLGVAITLGMQGEWSSAVLDWPLGLLLLYLGVGPTAGAYLCYGAGMARCRSAVIGLVASMIEPALAAVLAILILHESFGPVQIAGCLMLLAAMVVLWCGERHGVRPAPSERDT